jgi:hypothetical protein
LQKLKIKIWKRNEIMEIIIEVIAIIGVVIIPAILLYNWENN